MPFLWERQASIWPGWQAIGRAFGVLGKALGHVLRWTVESVQKVIVVFAFLVAGVLILVIALGAFGVWR